MSSERGVSRRAGEGRVSLWPENLERHRAEAMEAGSAAQHRAPDRPEETAAQRLARRRAHAAAFEQRSAAGVDLTVAGVRCRGFHPAAPTRGLYLHFHGGAMTLGSPLLNDQSNAVLAAQLRVEVVSVDYRLAPEHPHPSGLDDCVAVAERLLDSEVGPIVVGGESAGAYFAVMTLLRLRDTGRSLGGIRGANLVHGPFDLSGTPSRRGASPSVLEEHAPETIQDFLGAFVPGCDEERARRADISPLYADLRGMPPALFTVGTADRLLDDSLFMAQRWTAYGATAELAVYPDCGHAFTGLPIELARHANRRIAAFLDDAFT